MGIRDFISKHIVELPEAKQPTGKLVDPANTPTPVSQTDTSQPTSPMQPYLDPDMVADLNKLISRRPTPFSALQDTMAKFANIITDEVQRTKAAFELLKADGRTAGQIISAIDAHIMDIDSEERNFIITSQQVVVVKVEQLRSDAAALTVENDDSQRTIDELTKKIQELGIQIANKRVKAADSIREANAAESEIQRTIAKFQAAAKSVKATLSHKKMTLSSLLN